MNCQSLEYYGYEQSCRVSFNESNYILVAFGSSAERVARGSFDLLATLSQE